MQMNEGFLLTVFLVVVIATVLFYNATPVPSDDALPIQPDEKTFSFPYSDKAKAALAANTCGKSPSPLFKYLKPKYPKLFLIENEVDC